MAGLNDIVQISPENNPLYPLPADYNELSLDGQRKARVNACRLWLLPGPPEDLARRRVASLNFFDKYYLWPDEEADFDPGFYEWAPLETPDMHWAISRLWATARLSITIGPRGCAKSTHIRREMLLGMVTQPRAFQVYATSTHDNAKYTANIVRSQCYNNPRMQDDWSKFYGVDTLTPSKTDAPSGIEHFYLTTGSHIRSLSMETRVRGVRPWRFRVDDPEYDSKATTDVEAKRANFENFLFGVVLPAVMHRGSGCDWLATFVSPRHFAFHAMQVKQTPDGPKALDSRFDFWARFFIPAAYEEMDEEGKNTGRILSCWPEMWPATKEERLSKGMLSSVSLEEMRGMMGTALFNREMLGKITSGEDQFLKLDASPEGKHAYWYEEVDSTLATNPRGSTTKICWRNKDDTTTRMTMAEFLATARLFITVDTAYTEKAHSDRRVCHLMAINKDNLLFSLELWSDRKPDTVLIETTLRMAQKWQCKTICVEVVKESLHTYNSFKHAVATRIQHEMGFEFNPRVKDLRPGTMPKPAKISTLDLRFEHALVKLPLWKRYQDSSYDRLFSQIEDFNPGVQDGGLPHDDELDCYDEDALVLTRRGHVPLKEVTTNDEVLTAAGWKRVLKNADTGMQEVITRFGITATPHHPIWTLNRGYIELDSLSMDDILVVCNEKPSSTTGATTTATQTVLDDNTKSTTNATTRTKRPPDSCIGISTPITSEQFLPATSSTTRMEILSITTPPTSSVSPPGNTQENTWSPESPSENIWKARLPGSTWREYVRSRLNGTAPKRDANGVVRTLRNAVSESSRYDFVIMSAASAANRSSQRQPPLATVEMPAENLLTESPSDAISHGRRPTRCLQVEDVHQFFANGVLGSNTLSMQNLVIKGKPSEFIAAERNTPRHSLNLQEELKAGRTTIADGYDLLSGMDPSLMDMTHALNLPDTHRKEPNRA